MVFQFVLKYKRTHVLQEQKIFFLLNLAHHMRPSNANYKVWFEIWFFFSDKAAILPTRMSELAEPFSVTPTGRFLMASFITSSKDSILSILDQFYVKSCEISQCAENEVLTCVLLSNSAVVLHLNTKWTSHQSLTRCLWVQLLTLQMLCCEALLP